MSTPHANSSPASILCLTCTRALKRGVVKEPYKFLNSNINERPLPPVSPSLSKSFLGIRCDSELDRAGGLGRDLVDGAGGLGRDLVDGAGDAGVELLL
jgi:hypothetical protein